MSATTERRIVPQSHHEGVIERLAVDQRDAAIERASKLVTSRGEGSLTDAGRRAVEGHLAVADKWAARARDCHEGQLRVVSEPLTYAPESRSSFFKDLVIANGLGGVEGEQAQARLHRHRDEMAVELPARAARLEREQRARDGKLDVRFGRERRWNPNRTAGEGGNFAPPLWLIDLAALGVRPGRVLADLIGARHLPAGVQSVNVPQITTGQAVGVSLSGSPTPSVDLTDAATKSPCVPFAGHTDLTMQLLELMPPGTLDAVIMRDLLEARDGQVEQALFAGTGTNGQFFGILNLATGAGGVNSVVYSDASPTASGMYGSLGQAAARLGDNRDRPPEAWLMRTARWAWLGTGEDNQGLPLAVPGHQPCVPMPYNFVDTRPTPVVPILGWPNYCADAIPANLGAGANQDAIVCCRPSDFLLWESEPVIQIATDSISGSLEARITLRGYTAALMGRYPTGVSTVTGTGMIVQSGW
jgi:Phage capsid family